LQNRRDLRKSDAGCPILKPPEKKCADRIRGQAAQHDHIAILSRTKSRLIEEPAHNGGRLSCTVKIAEHNRRWDTGAVRQFLNRVQPIVLRDRAASAGIGDRGDPI